MPQPFELQKKRQLARQVSQASGKQAFRYYPNINVDAIDNEHVREALRQSLDNIYDTRSNYTPFAVHVVGSGNCTVTTTEQATGLSAQFTRQGRWIISACVSLDIVSDANQLFTLVLYVVDNKQALTAKAKLSGDGSVMISQNWVFSSTTGTETCKLFVVKDGGAGTSAIDLTNSTITATWQGT